jgi:hypothetical protein
LQGEARFDLADEIASGRPRKLEVDARAVDSIGGQGEQVRAKP